MRPEAQEVILDMAKDILANETPTLNYHDAMRYMASQIATNELIKFGIDNYEERVEELINISTMSHTDDEAASLHHLAVLLARSRREV